MSILREVLAELFSMFVADARLSAAVLLLVGAVAALLTLAEGLDPLIAGGLLLLGCLGLVIESVRRAARRS